MVDFVTSLDIHILPGVMQRKQVGRRFRLRSMVQPKPPSAVGVVFDRRCDGLDAPPALSDRFFSC